jgi:PBSX family phage portal protein
MAEATIKSAAKSSTAVYRLVELSKDLGPNGVLNPGDAVQGNAFEPEDEYQQLYVGATRDQGIIQPPYVLRTLDRLSQENNALGPCIETMVTNVDGTGYDFESDDGKAEDNQDDSNIKALNDFFGEPWPGMSFTTMRKLLRRDMERTGNAYLEVLRNAQDEIAFIRHVDAKMMRMLRLDDAVPVDVQVMRGGKQVKLTVMQRERRYCQLVNGVSLMYFKEFGSKRDLHKKTAVWAPQGQRLPAQMRATEIIHLTTLPDAHTPYGVPRWINQMPSVLGSRQAEEFNLEFFNNGGIPPVMILLQGGTLQAETRRSLEQKLSGEAKKNNRAIILEVEPSGGSLEQTPQARVTVERFGAERQQDSMFEKYDQRCEERIRRSFRLPPIFVGQANDYSFATAFASYTVAEAQVFKPDRDEFDEIVSMRLLPALGFAGYKMRSKPLVIEDATLKLQGLEVAVSLGDQVEPADVVEAINEVCGLHLKVSEAAPTLQDKLDQQKAAAQALPPGATHTMDAAGNIKPINPSPITPQGAPLPGSPGKNDQQPGQVKPKPVPSVMGGQAQPVKAPGAAKKADLPNGRDLAHATMKALRKRDFAELAFNLQIVSTLDDVGRQTFSEFANELNFIDTSLDPSGLAELTSCTLAVLAGQHNHAH